MYQCRQEHAFPSNGDLGCPKFRSVATCQSCRPRGEGGEIRDETIRVSTSHVLEERFNSEWSPAEDTEYEWPGQPRNNQPTQHIQPGKDLFLVPSNMSYCKCRLPGQYILRKEDWYSFLKRLLQLQVSIISTLQRKIHHSKG
jgi:hypothetical protein